MPVKVWKDKLDVHILKHIHYPPVEGSFFDDSVNDLKLAIVQDYNHHMDGANKSDRMANSCQLPYVEADKETISHLLNLTILNSHTLLKSHGSKLSVQTFN